MKAYYHPDQALHHPQTYFSRGMMRTPQEVPDRASALVGAVKQLGFDLRQPPDAGMAPLTAVHALDYLQFLKTAHGEWKQLPEDWGNEVVSNVFVREPNALRGVLAKAARYLADGSCPVGPSTWHSAYWSAQSAVAGADALLAGDRHAYALCRPPGHHARRDAAGGFCYLNNSAIAAQRLRGKYGRVVVLDTDMHHGQGIQEIFYERDDIYYVSIHGDPENFYPVVTGYDNEKGAGPGFGYNLNLPMPHGSPESVFFDKLAIAIDAIQVFAPDVVVLALGFDIFERDPQAKVAVSSPGFERLGKAVASLGVPVLVVQEGGYYIEGLQENAEAFFAGLRG
ncbi:acetylpolyamine amidohydrolase [Bordetella genomosp. 7]|uniref:Acetylpolyamine amidohydrolase n=1 Tax=Bordetella genomosp. 7 TaxID=1416805 RepID=A0A261QWG5_9BORD|nr:MULTISPECIES: histone deacetylase family protein [Bordetella]OZI15833.1 acetylpolyamine amidohydrolase [Bordetella genomosp. 7]OZI16877.1 acetylpolyamine amidohydrolase [Bordetella genomosp. 7]